jgi:hypothetical protein
MTVVELAEPWKDPREDQRDDSATAALVEHGLLDNLVCLE